MDVLYNVLARPVNNEPDKKDRYHIDRAQNDGQTKRIDEKDKENQGSEQQSSQQQSEQASDTDKKLDERLNEKKQGKGIYEDADGKKHLDFYA